MTIGLAYKEDGSPLAPPFSLRDLERFPLSIIEMTSFSVLLYRMYFAAQDFGIPGMLRRWPWTVRGLRQFKALIERHALPNKQVGSGRKLGCLRECGCGFVFRRKHATGAENMKPRCSMQFALRSGPVLLSMILALM